MFAAALGGGATLNGKPITVTTAPKLRGAEILAARPVMQSEVWETGFPGFIRVYRPSLAYRLSLVGQGRFDGMLTLRPTWEWDIAAGALIVTEAGGAVSTRIGGDLVFNNPVPKVNGVVAAGSQAHAQIIAALRPVHAA